MSRKEQQIPAIRFNGFTDAWEQRKLGDVVKNIGTGNSKFQIQEKSNDASYAILGSTSVIGYDNNFDFEGNFVLTARVGANAGTLYQHSGKVKISDNTVYIQSDNLSFLYNLLNRFDLKKLSFGTGQPLVKSSELKKLALNFPNKEEQEKIGNFFNQLDYTIALHQRQLDNYKQLKKSMKQKIFNQELRFKDADGNDYPKWERRTLGEISKIIMGQSPDSANYTSNEQDTVLIQGNADLNGGRITPRIYTTQITKTCEAGDIILTVRAPVGDLAIANTRACIGRGVCAIKGDPYIYHYLEMIRDTDGWRKIIQGSTFESINSTDVKDLPIVVPSSEERKKIAIFLSALNKKVENHENMINLLKEQKKGLMQQIFI